MTAKVKITGMERSLMKDDWGFDVSIHVTQAELKRLITEWTYQNIKQRLSQEIGFRLKSMHLCLRCKGKDNCSSFRGVFGSKSSEERELALGLLDGSCNKFVKG